MPIVTDFDAIAAGLRKLNGEEPTGRLFVQKEDGKHVDIEAELEWLKDEIHRVCEPMFGIVRQEPAIPTFYLNHLDALPVGSTVEIRNDSPFPIMVAPYLSSPIAPGETVNVSVGKKPIEEITFTVTVSEQP